MDIETFKTFLAAAATGSFARAAQRVNASPSSVTERIKQLEYRLGARLFERDKRGCRLTVAGERFIAPANQAVRAWNIGKHNVALPENFTESISFGGQYALWQKPLNQWLSTIRQSMPHVAFRVTAGAGIRLSRDLADNFLDIVVMYDPIFRQDIGTEKLYHDKLILVTANDGNEWRDHYVRIEWGQTIGTAIASRLNIAPSAGLILDLGARSANWLIDERMCGFMPETIIKKHLISGKLRKVDNVPEFDYPAYICWRRDLDQQTVDSLIKSLKLAFERDL